MKACKGCGEYVPYRERETLSGDSGYCEECRVRCAICNEWMRGEPEMRNHEGKRQHVMCEATVILEWIL